MKSPIATWGRCLFLGGLSSLLLWLAYFPVDFGWLAWIALVPLLLLVRIETTNRRRYWSAWLAGLVFFLLALSWMRVANPMMFCAWIGLSIYCSPVVPASIYLLRRLDARFAWPMTVTVPLVMVALEFVRSRFLGGFPWYLLGHTQHDVLPLIQIADVGGVAAITGLIAAVNGLITERLTRPSRTIRRQAVIVGVIAGMFLGYGVWRLAHPPFVVGPRVALLQGNLSQDLLNETLNDDIAPIRTILKHYVELMDEAQATHPDLIIWPETMFAPGLAVAVPGKDLFDIGNWRDEVEARLNDVAHAGRRSNTNVLLGIVTRDFDRDGPRNKYNSAVLVSPAGVLMARYDKIHCVPFGEFVPLKEYFPWLANLNPYEGRDYSLTPGTEFTRFPIAFGDRTYRFGVVICYEDSDAPLTTEYVAGPDKVDFLVNISNDGWFKCSQEHEQHLAIARFRAIECRRALLRAVNMGISAFIDSDGRVTKLPGPTWSESKGLTAVVSDRVPIDDRFSLFAMVGDWLSCLTLTVLGLLVVVPRRIFGSRGVSR